MASVDLTALKIARCELIPLAFGSVQQSPLGGSDNRVIRPGSRWMALVETPWMQIENEGRLLSALLDKAEYDGAIINVPQPDFDVGAPGSVLVASNTASGRVVPIKTATPQYAVKAGQAISFKTGGKWYFDRVTEEVIVGSGGTASVTIKNLIRRALSTNDEVQLASPKLEGSLVDVVPYTMETNRLTRFSFTIREEQ